MCSFFLKWVSKVLQLVYGNQICLFWSSVCLENNLVCWWGEDLCKKHSQTFGNKLVIKVLKIMYFDETAHGGFIWLAIYLPVKIKLSKKMKKKKKNEIKMSLCSCQVTLNDSQLVIFVDCKNNLTAIFFHEFISI